MAAGLTVYNSDNIVQIDGKHRNLQFKYKVSYTLDRSTWGAYSGAFTELIIPYSNTDIIAFGITNKFRIIGRCVEAPTQIRYAIMGASVGLVYEYFVFGYTQVSSGQHFEVYNEDGNLVYSDNAKFMKVLGYTSGGVSNNPAEGQQIISVAGNKVAVIYGAINEDFLFDFNNGVMTCHYNKWAGEHRHNNNPYNFIAINTEGL